MAGQTSEVEETMTRIMTHPHNKGVMAYIIVNQDGIPIRSDGLDKNVTIQYAGLISHLCTKARAAIRDAEPEKPNELTFLRLRSKKHEILVAPDKDYLLIIIQNPNVNIAGA